MKYLKLYEIFIIGGGSGIDHDWSYREPILKSRFFKISINDYLKSVYPKDYDYFMLDKFGCQNQRISYLDGIDKLSNIKYLDCSNNILKSLNGIENCKILRNLMCAWNKLENLNGIENLINLKVIDCRFNNLKNLNGIEKLEKIYSEGNLFDYPIPIDIVNKFGFDNIYGSVVPKNKGKNVFAIFRSYEYQKKFLTEFPEKFKDIELFGLHEKIKEEFADIIEGNEFGFFNLR